MDILYVYNVCVSVVKMNVKYSSLFAGCESQVGKKTVLCWFCIVPHYYIIIFTTTKQLISTQPQEVEEKVEKKHAHSLTDKCDFMLIVERLPGEFYPFMLSQAFHLIPAARINLYIYVIYINKRIPSYHIHIRKRTHVRMLTQIPQNETCLT